MKQNSERGSTHVIAIICLVAALIVALGWIFWQNFIHKEASVNDASVSVLDKKTDGNLAVEKWNIEIPGAKRSFYQAKSIDNPAMFVGTDQINIVLAKPISTCGAGLGVISRISPNEELSEEMKTHQSSVAGRKVTTWGQVVDAYVERATDSGRTDTRVVTLGSYEFVFQEPSQGCTKKEANAQLSSEIHNFSKLFANLKTQE